MGPLVHRPWFLGNTTSPAFGEDVQGPLQLLVPLLNTNHPHGPFPSNPTRLPEETRIHVFQLVPHTPIPQLFLLLSVCEACGPPSSTCWEPLPQCGALPAASCTQPLAQATEGTAHIFPK